MLYRFFVHDASLFNLFCSLKQVVLRCQTRFGNLYSRAQKILQKFAEMKKKLQQAREQVQQTQERIQQAPDNIIQEDLKDLKDQLQNTQERLEQFQEQLQESDNILQELLKDMKNLQIQIEELHFYSNVLLQHALNSLTTATCCMEFRN